MAGRLLSNLFQSCRTVAASACNWAADRLLGTSDHARGDVDMATVQEGMDVVSAYGQLLGSVECVALFSNRIVVRTFDGEQTYVPRAWVERVTDKVRLRLNGVASRDERGRAMCAA